MVTRVQVELIQAHIADLRETKRGYGAFGEPEFDHPSQEKLELAQALEDCLAAL